MQRTPLPALKPHPAQSDKEVHLKYAKGKEIIMLHSVTSFGRKFGTWIQS